MSTGSKVALASAAGVLAATAAGLATTRKGRAFTRKVKRKVSPIIHERMTTVVDTIESTLAEYGVLNMIPDEVRRKIHQRLGVPMGRAGSSQRKTPSGRVNAQSRSRRSGASAGSRAQ